MCSNIKKIIYVIILTAAVISNNMSLLKAKDKEMFEYNDAIVEIKLIDSSTNNYIKQASFEFALYKDEGCMDKLSSILSDNRTGLVSFKIRNNDVLYLKQKQAADGYSLSSKVVKLEYKNDTLYVDDRISKFKHENVFAIFFFNDLDKNAVKNNELLLGLLLTIFIMLELGLMVIINERRLNDEKN